MDKKEYLLSVGFEPTSDERTYYYYLDKGRKIIVDINVVSLDGHKDAVYLKQLEDIVYLFEFNKEKIETLIKHTTN